MAEFYVYQPFKLRHDRGAIAVTDDADRHLRDKILAVLFTAPGERVNAPSFGVGLDRTVFEGLDELTVAAVEFRIAEGVRRELGDEALIDARRRRDRSRQRTAADLDRLPPPLGPQPAQPGDRPVSDAPLSWNEAQLLDGTPWQGIRYLSIEFRRGRGAPGDRHRAPQPARGLPDGRPRRRQRRAPAAPCRATRSSSAGSTVVLSFRGFGDHSPYTVELTDGGGAPLHPFFASAEFRFTIDCDVGRLPRVADGGSTPARPAAGRRPADEGLQRLRHPARRLGQGPQPARRRPLGRELRARGARPARLGRRHAQLLPGPRRQRGLRRDRRPALLAAPARRPAGLQARRRARADDACSPSTSPPRPSCPRACRSGCGPRRTRCR